MSKKAYKFGFNSKDLKTNTWGVLVTRIFYPDLNVMLDEGEVINPGKLGELVERAHKESPKLLTFTKENSDTYLFSITRVKVIECTGMKEFVELCHKRDDLRARINFNPKLEEELLEEGIMLQMKIGEWFKIFIKR
jgi:hypothetical protein